MIASLLCTESGSRLRRDSTTSYTVKKPSPPRVIREEMVSTTQASPRQAVRLSECRTKPALQKAETEWKTACQKALDATHFRQPAHEQQNGPYSLGGEREDEDQAQDSPQVGSRAHRERLLEERALSERYLPPEESQDEEGKVITPSPPPGSARG